MAQPTAPAGGAHVVGEVANIGGQLYVCVASGTPGTWASVGFNPIVPLRILDTRANIGLSGKQLAGASNVRNITVAPNGPVPAQATAVAFNLTVTQPSSLAFLTIWPAGATMPTASNINFTANETIANFALVKVGSGGKLSIFLNTGSTHVIMDVAGYYI